MSDNQNEETEQSGPTEEPEVEGFAVLPGLKPIKGGPSIGLGPSDWMKKVEYKVPPLKK